MEKIDIVNWKEFELGSLFKIVKGSRLTKSKMKEGSTRFIGSSSLNNGCTALVGNKENIQKGNAITVCYNGSVGETFYQDLPFLASDDVNILYPKFKMSKAIALFLSAIIKKTSRKYDFNNKWKIEIMIKEKIPLPADSRGNPDWEYMDGYMTRVLNESEASLENLRQADDGKHAVDTARWKEFVVGELFEIRPTKAYKMTNAQLMDDGNNPVVVNSSYSNGVGGYTSLESTEKGNLVTFSDTTTAEAVFYQPNDFVGYPHVQGMYPKGEYASMWKEQRLLFFVTVFKQSAKLRGFDYAFKFTREIAANMKVPLPVDAEGNPDWAYMDVYMSKVMRESEANLENLRL